MPIRIKFQLIVSCFVLFAFLNNITLGSVYNRSPFQYRYNGRDTELIDRLDVELRKKLKYIESHLDVKFEGSVRIYLTLSLEEFNEITRGRVPRWAGGVANPRQKRIVIKTPLFFGQGVPIEVLAAHELSHILIHQIVGDNYLPRWLEEGLCQVLSGETRSGSMRRLGRAAAANRLMGLPRVDYVLGFSRPDADLAYVEARYAAAKLIDQFNWQAIVDLLRKVGQGIEFEDAFFQAIGVDYEVWQVEWLEYARSKYSLAVLLELDHLIWIVIVLLGAVAVIATFIRRRMQFKRWREEEEDDTYDDYNEPINP